VAERSTARRLALAAGALLLLAGCSSADPGDEGGYREAVVLDQPYHPAKVPLTDTDGRPYTFEAPADGVTLVFFGYTHCPDICSQVMSTIAAARLRLPEQDRERVGVAFVTTDPARDTPDVLREYLDRFDPSFTGVTGDLDDVVHLGESLAVYVGKGRKLPSGGYDVEHNDQVEALTGAGTVTAMWMRDVSAGDLAHDLQTLLDEERS